MTLRFSTDVLVIGSGAAGLATALHLSPHARVIVLSKDDIRGGSTNRAQGGVATVSQPADSVDAHVHDTVVAGAGLCNEKIVRYVVSRARQAIDHIEDLGLEFDQPRRLLLAEAACGEDHPGGEHGRTMSSPQRAKSLVI